MGKVSPEVESISSQKAKNVGLNYKLRLIACLVVFSLHISLLWGDDHISYGLWAVLLLHCLVYPHVIYSLSSTTEDEARNITIDAFFYSFCCAVWGFNLFLIAALISTTNMTTLASGGRKLFLKGLAVQALGFFLGGILAGFYYRPDLSTFAFGIVAVGLILYTSSLGMLLHQINNSLRRNRRKVESRKVYLEHMNELAFAVNSTLDLDSIMKGLMKALETVYPFESLYVISKMPDNRTFKIVGAYGSAVSDFEELTFKKLEMDIEQDPDSIFISGLEKDRIINIPNLSREAVESGAEIDKVLYNIKPSRSIAYFPVHVQNEVVAGVAFINYDKTFDLKSEDLHSISEYLVQVGTAIKNVSMYEMAEKARKTAEESEQAKGRFLANMSHEIRTPMTAIIGYSEALLDDSLTKQNKEKFANTIIRSSRHLLTVINDILDISKIESSKIDVETMDVEMAAIISDLDDYVRQQTKEKGLSYQLQIQYPLPSIVQADPTRLKQILFNLTNNAVKFTKDGWVKVEISFAYEKMTFNIEDSGIGLDSEEKSRLFSAFTQADSSTTRLFGGSGLGLFISKNLAHLMGGELTVESEKGVGSCFTLTLGSGGNASSSYIQTAGMLSQLMDEYKSQQKTQFVPKLTGKVLLAEDNLDNQLLIKRLISASGADVAIVDDGVQALDRIEKESFDLVFLDMQMPNMGGEEAAQIMRQKGIQTPLVAFTANVMKHQVDQYIENGFNQVVEKPISHDQLYSVMQTYLQPQKNLGAVLIVEDNLVNQQIMQRLVKKANPQVSILTADNGYEALKVCEKETVNLIFMDMEMPIMGGLEATEKLREQKITAPIYMITGHVDAQHKQQSLDAGADGYLVKPVDKDRLFSLIHTVFS